ncbi:TIR-like protein FxsC [Streptacidiphilus cavernicola]|uniref:TIR-like protein FxsC n=1 Tax=Streptacidiphilus cavernicola TaxID=3342716 RepID=A0ABV6VPT9_9ACTN
MTPADRLREALELQDARTGLPELLDVLWLAGSLSRDDGSVAARWADGGQGGDTAPAGGGGGDLADTASPGDSPLGAEGAGTPVHAPVPAPGSARVGRSALVPGARAVPGPVRLRRALAPLRRRTAAGWAAELDETATAERIARTQTVEPVFHTRTVRWTDLVLVVDDSVSMRLWQDLAKELRRLLVGLGAFRRITVLGLDGDSAEQVVLHERPFGQRTARPPALTGRPHPPVVLVLTDGVGAAWRSAAVPELLTAWAARAGVALVQPLPPTLWSGTALRPVRRSLRATTPASTNAGLVQQSSPLHQDSDGIAGHPLPVLELTAAQLGGWAALTAQGGSAQLSVVDSRGIGRAEPGAPRHEDPEQLLNSYRAGASPEAYRLATHLATVEPLTLPVMRVVQAAVLPGSHPGILAEVFLSGLLSTDADSPPSAEAVYALRPGLDGLLLSAVGVGEGLDTLRAVSAFFERPTGRPASMRVLLGDPEGGVGIAAGGRPMAEVGGPFLRYLGVLPAVGASSGDDDAEPSASRVRAPSVADALEAALAEERLRSGALHPAVTALELRLAEEVAGWGPYPRVAALVGHILEAARRTGGPAPEFQAGLERITARLAERDEHGELLGRALAVATALNRVREVQPLDWLTAAVSTRKSDRGVRGPLNALLDLTARPDADPAELRELLADLARALGCLAEAAAYRRTVSPRRTVVDPDLTSWRADTNRPVFFLSYAHSGGIRHEESDPFPQQVFRDLSSAVSELSAIGDGGPVAFMDRGIQLGEGWEQRISEAVAQCRVFVPLYSPRYFRSVACGQEWSAFTSRDILRAPRSDGRPSGVVPVLWVPTPLSSLPPVAQRLQFNHGDFGDSYGSEGLYALAKLNYFRSDYELAIHRLAQQIVRVAEQTDVIPGRPRNLMDYPSAFADPSEGREFLVLVLSADEPADWRPYGDDDPPVAERAARVVRDLGATPVVRTFEAEAPMQLRNPVAPGVLLIDRRALLDREKRDLLLRFLERVPPWIGVLCPRVPDGTAPDDTASDDTASDEADRLAAALLPRADDLSTPRDFTTVLAQLITRTRQAFDTRDLAPD